MFGATAVGLICQDSVVLAADKRISYGAYIVSERGQKVFKVTDKIGAACAGLMADMKKAIDYLKINIELYAAEKKGEISVKGAVNLLSLILFSRRLNPFYVQVLVGGVDSKGPQLYSLDPVGSAMFDNFAAVGSGTQVSLGVMEKEYRKGFSIDEGVNLAKKALFASMKRDAITGANIDIMVITQKGIRVQTENISQLTLPKP